MATVVSPHISRPLAAGSVPGFAWGLICKSRGPGAAVLAGLGSENALNALKAGPGAHWTMLLC